MQIKIIFNIIGTIMYQYYCHNYVRYCYYIRTISGNILEPYME
jgi:hypothetical protein